ncbi:MAG: hypothetical protein PHZ19_10080 [Candidatus Thermoplasmatota archaeon]|nr:hypothetical protein [Candidatus Thermoplasmatota archaeon]
MSRAYTIALALFAFGFVVGGVNGLGIFTDHTALPGSDIALTDSRVTEITDGATSGGASPLYPITILFTLGRVFFEGVMTALTIIPLLTSYGISPLIAMMFQGPIWFVYIAAILQFFTGRSLKGVE